MFCGLTGCSETQTQQTDATDQPDSAAQLLMAAKQSAFAHERVLDMSGGWRFELDPQDKGITEKWFERKLSGEIKLPGSLQEHNIGDPIGPNTPWTGSIVDRSWFTSPRYAKYREPGNIKVPFWLQSKTHYVGAAWFQRDINLDKSWAGSRVVLTLERVHWASRLWLNGREMGMRNSLSTPHEYDLGIVPKTGSYRITVCVDNRIKEIKVGQNSHSVSDHTQSNWNGIVGKLRLKQSHPSMWVDDLQFFPDLKQNKAHVKLTIGNPQGMGKGIYYTWALRDKAGAVIKGGKAVQTTSENTDFLIDLDPSLARWDEFNPNLYTFEVALTDRQGNKIIDSGKTITTGFRQVVVDGTRIMLNGRKIFLRGTLECSIFPLTGYPATDVESWKRIIRICKAHGLNHIRFHSWCPPEAAFIAADELGFYYQVECASWANQGATIGDGKPIDRWLYEESERIVKAYGNHPSFIMLAYGNEPAGKHMEKWLGEWVSHWKNKDRRRLYTSGAGWPAIPENQFHNIPEPRLQQWGEGLGSRINGRVPETVSDYRDIIKKHDVPVISHEIGQWCVYPNFDEIRKYTGVLKPKNFDIFGDFLKEAGMWDQAHDFLMASGKLQAMCYKEEIEAALRTPGFGGFQLLDLHDFPGQGTALVGVLDPFWDSKPYLSAKEHIRYSGPIVPLARLPERVFTSSDTLTAQVDISQFGSTDLKNAAVKWSLLNADGQAVKKGVLKKNILPVGDLHTIGDIAVKLSDLPVPAKYKLELAVENTDAANDWDIWVYPPAVQTDPGDVQIVDSLDEHTENLLAGGKTVWLMADPAAVKTDVKLGLSSIFWNTAWTGGQAPHTLGILCDPKHAALSDFPTEYHSNWQWWELISSAATMELDALDGDLRPIVQVVPDWFDPKKLGLVFEARVGNGKLLVTAIDLKNNMANRAVARQMRASLLRYLKSDAFKPSIECTSDQIRGLFKSL